MCIVACSESQPNQSRVEALPFYNEATFTPHWISPDDVALDTFHRISPFELTNQEGNIITEETFEGKIYVADFFFAVCPGICPKMTTNMMKLQDEFLEDEDVLLLSHSVTPESDSVPVLKRYADDKGILSHKWHLATGAQQEIYTLGRKDYFVEEDLGLTKKDDDFLHTENFVLIDKNRHIRGIYNGLNKASINQLIADIKA
ncbi:MAG: SCO family protein, partial [Bacteroidia bacterium]|nr:SCO family protein [Bacteroidia bacterium]